MLFSLLFTSVTYYIGGGFQKITLVISVGHTKCHEQCSNWLINASQLVKLVIIDVTGSTLVVPIRTYDRTFNSRRQTSNLFGMFENVETVDVSTIYKQEESESKTNKR